MSDGGYSYSDGVGAGGVGAGGVGMCILKAVRS